MQQTKIDLEQAALRILNCIISFEPADEGDWVVWTADILSTITRLDHKLFARAIGIMQKLDYLCIHNGEYVITQGGRDYYDAAKRKPEIKISIQKWREEVLTGMTTNGKRSNIVRAVLPGSTQPTQTKNEIEETFCRHELNRRLKKKVLRELGISMFDYEKKLVDGSIQICKGIGDGKHVGIFHRKRKGKGWQHLCIKCRQQQRKKKCKQKTK